MPDEIPWPQLDKVANLVARLRDLRTQTDPENGSNSAIGKDQAAFQALTMAGALVEELAGWAIAHTVGLAHEGLDFVPLGPGTDFRRSAQNLAALRDVDDHRHEKLGEALRHGIVFDENSADELVQLSRLNAHTARRVAIALLLANPGAIPPEVALVLRDALIELDANKVHAILEPTKRHVRLTREVMRLQLRAVCIVRFRATAKNVALEHERFDVAEAFNVSDSSVKGWEQELKASQGPLNFKRALAFATEAGKTAKGDEQAIARHPNYGDDKLRIAGLRYRELDGRG